jgi:hypothetical protein
MVDSHVEELRKQLQGKSKSVIDWIQGEKKLPWRAAVMKLTCN